LDEVHDTWDYENNANLLAFSVNWQQTVSMFRIEPPFRLYVDEITPDEIKATTSDAHSLTFNMRVLTRFGGVQLGEPINGIYLFPAGRYICMLVKSTLIGRTADGMVLLDLRDRPDLAYEMGEKFAGTALQEKFSVCYTYILDHPETHEMFTLVEGIPRISMESIFPLKPRPPYES
jgi:hypothetical protein